MAHMKQLKIIPNGGESLLLPSVREDIIAGDQKNTKRYMEPSNSVVVVANANTRGSSSLKWDPFSGLLLFRSYFAVVLAPNLMDTDECCC